MKRTAPVDNRCYIAYHKFMTKKIPLTRGMYALVDDEDYGWLMQWKWYAYPAGRGEPRFYAGRGTSTGGKVLMHRELIKARPGLDVDHENGKTLDNRKKNLKEKTRSQNVHGYRRNSHDMTGIRKIGNRYRASIMIDYKRSYKYFKTADEARCWRESMKP